MNFKRKGYFRKISDALPKIVAGNLKKANFIEISVLKSWKEIVGTDLAESSSPIKIIFNDKNNINGKLIISVEIGKSLDIEYKHDEIIERLNQYFGYKAITKINIIQNFETNTQKKAKYKLIKKPSKKNNLKDIEKIKETKIKKALKRLDKTLFSYN